MVEYSIRAILNSQDRASDFADYVHQNEQLSLVNQRIYFATYSRDSRQLSSVFNVESDLDEDNIRELLVSFDDELDEREAVDIAVEGESDW